MRVLGKLNTLSSKSGTPLPPISFDFLKVHIPPPPDSSSAATTDDKPPTPPPRSSAKAESDDGYNLRDSRKKRSELDYNLREAPAKKMKSSSSAKKSGKGSSRNKHNNRSARGYTPPKKPSPPIFKETSVSGHPSSLPPTKGASVLLSVDGSRKHQEEPSLLYEGSLITEALDDDFQEASEQKIEDLLHMSPAIEEYLE